MYQSESEIGGMNTYSLLGVTPKFVQEQRKFIARCWEKVRFNYGGVALGAGEQKCLRIE